MPTKASRASRWGNRRAERRMMVTAGEVEAKARRTSASGYKAAPPAAAPIHPPAPPPGGLSITHEMISRLAQRYWELRGGNTVLNWLEAERALQDLQREAPRSDCQAATHS